MPIPLNFEFLPPWEPLSAARAQQLSDELRRELSSGHPLLNATVSAVAARNDRDDVLFEIGRSEKPLAVAHLSWQKESKPEWPSIHFFDSWDDWASRSMIPAHSEGGTE